jgi:hypothetical protein
LDGFFLTRKIIIPISRTNIAQYVRPRFIPVIGKVLADLAGGFFPVAVLVGDSTVVAVVAGTIVDVVEVGATVVVGDVTGSVFDDIVNSAPAPCADMTKSPAAVQFLGVAHETEEKVEGEKESDCTPLANTAGRARSHAPFVDVMVKAVLWL